MSRGMLDGVRVIDLTTVVIGPLCTQILADHGADVIKVESPEGDLGRTIGGIGKSSNMSPKFLHLNRNKRSICLDLRNPDGYDVLMDLLKNADVMIWNLRPASMERLRLTYEDVKSVNDRIIYCGMFGFGRTGRYADLPAYDPIIQSASGIANLAERAFGSPSYVPYVVADRTVGLIAVQMVAMALFCRERTGLGQSIEVPMFENMATQTLTEHLYQHTYVPPLGQIGDPRLLNKFYTPTKTLDGYVSISANTNEQVFALFDAMELSHLRTDPRFNSISARFKNVEEFNAIRTAGIAKKTTGQWIDICRQHDIPCGPYHTLDTLLDDPHLRDVGFIKKREHPTEGSILDLRPANTVSGGERTDWLPAPRLGEHTVSVLEGIGYSPLQIDQLLAKGSVFQDRSI